MAGRTDQSRAVDVDDSQHRFLLLVTSEILNQSSILLCFIY